MLKAFNRLLGIDRHVDGNPGRKKILGSDSFSRNMRSFQSRNNTVIRVIHPGRCQELFQNEFSAAKLMEKYPGMCVAKPEVFKNPNESILLAEEKLLFGHKYYLIPSTTVEKLKRKEARAKRRAEGNDEGRELLFLDKMGIGDFSGDFSEEYLSVCSAKDFYVSREEWGINSMKRCTRGKRTFVPPIQKPKMWTDLGWEPTLDSIQEISP